jgi:hypothetical protein
MEGHFAAFIHTAHKRGEDGEGNRLLSFHKQELDTLPLLKQRKECYPLKKKKKKNVTHVHLAWLE